MVSEPVKKLTPTEAKQKIGLFTQYLRAPTREAKIAILRKIIGKPVKPVLKKPLIPHKPKPKTDIPRPKTTKEKIMHAVRTIAQWRRYQATGKVPEGVTIPPEVKELGKEAERAYVKASVDVTLGKPEKQVTKELARVMEREFKKLPLEKREEYGYKFTKWEEIPIYERKYYPGAKKHFAEFTEEQKTEVFKKYAKRHPGLKLIIDAGYKVERWSPEMRETVWEDITTPYEELKRKRYEKMPLWLRTLEAASWGAATALTTPVLIAEEVAKRVTKYKPVGAKALAYVQRGPPGLISATIEEGIAKVTKQRSEAYQKMAKYPVEAIGATIGEIAGILMLGKGIKAAGRGVKEITKGTIRTIPRITRVITKYRPYRIRPVKIGKEAVGPLEKIVRKPIIKDIRAWAKGEKIFRREVPLKAVKVKQKLLPPDVDVYIKKVVYKGIGKPKLVPKEMLIRKPGRFVEITFKKVYEAPGVGRKVLAAHMEKLTTKGVFVKRIEKVHAALTKEWKWGRRYYPPPEAPALPRYLGRPPVTIAIQRYIPISIKKLWKSQEAAMRLIRPQVETVRRITGTGIGVLGRGAEAFIYVPYTVPVGLLSLGVVGWGRAIAKVQAQQQKIARLAIGVPKVGMKTLYLGLEKIADITVDVSEDVDKMIKEMQVQTRVTIPKVVPEIPKVEEPLLTVAIPKTLIPKFKFPFAFVLIDEEEEKRRRRIITPEEWKRFYYYREFKVPRFEQVMKKIEKRIVG